MNGPDPADRARIRPEVDGGRGAPGAGMLSAVGTYRSRRRVIVLAPMPLEMDAIVKAFGLTPPTGPNGTPSTGRVGGSDVTCHHIGMGPALTRSALNRLLAEAATDGLGVDHVMVAGICGGLHPDLEVGTLVNPEMVIDQASGARYRHQPPGDQPQRGNLVTTERVMFDAT